MGAHDLLAWLKPLSNAPQTYTRLQIAPAPEAITGNCKRCGDAGGGYSLALADLMARKNYQEDFLFHPYEN